MSTSGVASSFQQSSHPAVPLFADLNDPEIQEIARLFKEHRFAKGGNNCTGGLNPRNHLLDRIRLG